MGGLKGWVSGGVMLVGVAAWLWPIGLGGRMPVGGDVSAFSIGLMSVLSEALGEWRLPYWNDLWGYGFPGVAESQMGVYYPPHVVLYGVLPVEAAYAASLVLHTFWAAVGTMWAARRFGVSREGAALAGFVGASCGFYQIHLTHPWGVEVGSWMPWVWGLGWKLRKGEGGFGSAALLAAAVAVQVLPGHFQLAFETQVGLVVLLGVGLMGGEGSRKGVVWAGLAMVGAGVLAAAQVVPTWRLAKLAEMGRTWEYLSGFSATPWHLVSYVAPGLFHRSPLWREVAWDPFHTSPEEHLAYVGLVPLWLAIGAVWRGWRRSGEVRALGVLVAVATWLSLGPYVPGFSALIGVPGFSFFRAPARWGLVAMEALAVLSGWGWDRLRGGEWGRIGRSLGWFVGVSVVVPVVLVGVFEVALASTEGAGWPGVASVYKQARRVLPWSGDRSFREVMGQSRRPSGNPIVVRGLMRRGQDPRSRLAESRWGIYGEELGPTMGVLAGLVGLALVARWPRVLAGGLVILTGADLLVLNRVRDVDMGPIAPMTGQSSVLGALQRGPRGARSIDPLGNLVMRAGAAPVRAYRTLDLPTMGALTEVASRPWGAVGPSEEVREAMRVVGARVRVFDPFAEETRGEQGWVSAGSGEGDRWFETTRFERFEDRALAGWLFGEAWARSGGAERTRFVVARMENAPHGWVVGEKAAERVLKEGSNRMGVGGVVSVLGEAEEVGYESEAGGTIRVGEMRVEEGAVVVLPVQHDAQWRGEWRSGGRRVEAEPLRAFPEGAGGGWLAARVPGKGRWRLVWEYEPRAERLGQWVSVAGWVCLVGLWVGRRLLVRRMG